MLSPKTPRANCRELIRVCRCSPILKLMNEQIPETNVVTLATKSAPFGSLKVDFTKIRRDGFQILRGFGTDLARLEYELSSISGGKLFYSDRIGSFVHQFRVLRQSENLSEQPSCGGYHTDFMFQARPPEFVALLCLHPDPKHPLFGRNQIVPLDAFVERLNTIFGVTENDLKTIGIDYTFPGRLPISVSILNQLDGKSILKLHTTLMPEGKLKAFDNLPLKSAIEAVCGEVAEDLVLNRGDLLIMSNHSALHRRSECTLAFDSSCNSFRSREMATIRFDR